MQKLIVIVGPTASGKSDLGVTLARHFNGEIVSADSRQVYKGLDIGSGKITKKEMMGIPHHLLDVASPKRKFTVAAYQKLARKAIKGTQKRDKLPVVVGGTPFYVYALIDGYIFPEVKANIALRADLEKLSVEQLLVKLKKLDRKRANTLKQSSGQEKNKRRLIRALEIVMTTGKPVPKFDTTLPIGQNTLFDILMIGVKRDPKELKTRIHKRLLKRLHQGMIKEVEQLHTPPTKGKISTAGAGLSWKRLEELGLEYRYVAQYLQQKISYAEMVDFLEKAIIDFSRRQMLWFKRDPRIHWVSSYPKAKHLVSKFLS